MLMCLATAAWISCAPVPHPDDASWTLPRIVDYMQSRSVPLPVVAAGVVATGHPGLAAAVGEVLAKAAQEKKP